MKVEYGVLHLISPQQENRKEETKPEQVWRSGVQRQVVAVDEKKNWTIYDSVAKAARAFGYKPDMVNRTCKLNQKRISNGKRKINTDHKCHGIRFYYEDDVIWMEKIRKSYEG